jgi:hypothetical protein
MPVLFVFMVMATESRGMDLTLTTRAGAVFSDNIHRDGSGFEENGSLLTQGAGINMSQESGRRSLNLSLDGGWETLDSKTRWSSEEVYRIDMNVGLPWSQTGRIEGTARTSRETGTPEVDDPDQGRLLTKHINTGLHISDEASAVTRWRIGADQRTEESTIRNLVETTTNFEWSRDFSRVSAVTLQGSNTRGDDDLELSSWKTNKASVVLNNRIKPNVTRSYRLFLEKSTVKEPDDLENESENVGVEIRYTSEKPDGLSYEIAIGFDHLKTPSDEKVVEPSAEVILSGPMSRTVIADGSIEYSLRIQDPLETETEWTRVGRFSAGLAWSATRYFLVLPGIEYIFEDIQGWETLDRTDQTIIAKLNTRWFPARTWAIALGVVLEERDSTENSFELSEGRLELNISTTI